MDEIGVCSAGTAVKVRSKLIPLYTVKRILCS